MIPTGALPPAAWCGSKCCRKAFAITGIARAWFYETFFQPVSAWASISEPLAEEAFLQARNFGLHAMDALHIAAALSVWAEEFITSERSEKPINKLTAITVRTIEAAKRYSS